jgi:hypothetical protein
MAFFRSTVKGGRCPNTSCSSLPTNGPSLESHRRHDGLVTADRLREVESLHLGVNAARKSVDAAVHFRPVPYVLQSWNGALVACALSSPHRSCSCTWCCCARPVRVVSYTLGTRRRVLNCCRVVGAEEQDMEMMVWMQQPRNTGGRRAMTLVLHQPQKSLLCFTWRLSPRFLTECRVLSTGVTWSSRVPREISDG